MTDFNNKIVYCDINVTSDSPCYEQERCQRGKSLNVKFIPAKMNSTVSNRQTNLANQVSTNNITRQYVLTRKNHIRCFPHCSSPHTERSFCGDSLLVSVIGDCLTNKHRVRMFGYFQHSEHSLGIHVNDCVSDERLEKMYQATLVWHQWNEIRYSFNPSRKWECNIRPRCNQLVSFVEQIR
jgi:hypothetical protein